MVAAAWGPRGGPLLAVIRSMSFVLWCLAGIFVILMIAFVAIVRVARKQGPEILAARCELFEQTGYVHPDLVNGFATQQAQFVPRRRGKLGETGSHYLRQIDASHAIEFRSSMTFEAGKRVHRLAWRLPLARRPRVVFQIADRRLSSLGKVAREAFTRTSRTWSPIYPGPLALVDPALSARFVAFGPDAAAVNRCLAVPGLRELLLACAEVDLIVTETEIELADPSDRNIGAARGGTVGRVRIGIAESIRASIPVHRRMIKNPRRRSRCRGQRLTAGRWRRSHPSATRPGATDPARARASSPDGQRDRRVGQASAVRRRLGATSPWGTATPGGSISRSPPQESTVQIQMLIPLVFVGLALFYGQYMKRKRAAGIKPALESFLGRTGYRYVEILQAPLDQQAAHGEAVMRDMAKGFRIHMIRDFHGISVHNHQSGQPTSNGWSSSFSWTLALATPPRGVFQLADKGLAGIGKVVKEAFSNTRRTWTPVYPIKVQSATPISIVAWSATPSMPRRRSACCRPPGSRSCCSDAPRSI